jgi:hypothetical protein
MAESAKTSIASFRTKLGAIRHMRGFIARRDSSTFAQGLAFVLESLAAGVSDPRTGVELVAAFYETDDVIFNHCDDSNGRIGDVFRHDARELFVHYASRCEEKAWLASLLLKLNRNDGFGLRDHLFGCAAEYLPEAIMRGLIDSLWELAQRETNKYQRWHWLHGIESLARQLRDAPVFERARRASWPTLGTAACVDIAAVYLESGDPATALSWLERIPESETFQEDERDQLLLAVHGELGNGAQQEAVAWRIFRRYRCEETLQTLLSAKDKLLVALPGGMMSGAGGSVSPHPRSWRGGRPRGWPAKAIELIRLLARSQFMPANKTPNEPDRH